MPHRGFASKEPFAAAGLAGLVVGAWKRGQSVATAALEYGPVHSAPHIRGGAPNYYRFLAGFTAVTGSSRILEIGTYHGGSAQALLRGVPETAIPRLVTVDIHDLAGGALEPHPEILRIIGDASSAGVVNRILMHFSWLPVDLLFVDSAHDYATTTAHLGIMRRC